MRERERERERDKPSKASMFTLPTDISLGLSTDGLKMTQNIRFKEKPCAKLLPKSLHGPFVTFGSSLA